MVIRQLGQSKFRRMEHPPKSPNLAGCDFFLLGYAKDHLEGRRFAEKEELCQRFLNLRVRFRLT
jgi:hypothetical protein